MELEIRCRVDNGPMNNIRMLRYQQVKEFRLINWKPIELYDEMCFRTFVVFQPGVSFGEQLAAMMSGDPIPGGDYDRL